MVANRLTLRCEGAHYKLTSRVGLFLGIGR